MTNELTERILPRIRKKYLKRASRDTLRYIKSNIYHSLFIQRYNLVLTDNAIILARSLYNRDLSIWAIEQDEEAAEFIFTNIENQFHLTTHIK